ncbi:unnamed protein product [Cercopithifilaria johnstoni]|uniref:Uncharacterized protein n=1 Tax=Cercopithifilaria johnstoni TaxID=2874296 RepID=A0A8J2Q7D1_9BILA|nr:unnamed protein product [Cercopithifilaria johnstoni]
MSTLGRKYSWNNASAKEAAAAATAIANSTAAPTYLFCREEPKMRSSCGMTLSKPVGRKTTLENCYFESTIKEHPSFEKVKQTGDRTEGANFSFKVPNTRCMKKDELIMSSLKRNYSDTDLKPPIRTVVRSGSSSDLLEKAVLERTKVTLISKLPSDVNSTQDSSSEKISNAPPCTLKPDLRRSCSSSPRKRKVEGKADTEPSIKLEKKMDSKKKVLLMGKTISMTPSLTASDKVSRNGNKCFPGVICSSRLSTTLNRNSEWEKAAMKGKPVFLKHRSQKMLKDRLKKYCVMTRKSHMDNSEKLDAEKATPVAPHLSFKKVLPICNQGFFDLCSSDLNKNGIEQSGTSYGSNESKAVVEKSTPSKKNLDYGISEFGIQDAKKIPFSSPTKSPPLAAINKNNQQIMSNKGNVKELSLNSDIKDSAEIEIRKEVESLVEKALLQTAANSYFRANQDLRKSVSDSVQEGRDFNVTKDNTKLRKMWALVAEESSLANSLNDITAKINKIKMDLYTLSNESFQITKRLDEVRLLKSQLLNNSDCKFYSNLRGIGPIVAASRDAEVRYLVFEFSTADLKISRL